MSWQAIALGIGAKVAKKLALWFHYEKAHQWAEKWRADLRRNAFGTDRTEREQ